MSSSGFVPSPCSKRVAKEYGVLLKTPPWVVSVPFPCLRFPFQMAEAVRFIKVRVVFSGGPGRSSPMLDLGIVVPQRGRGQARTRSIAGFGPAGLEVPWAMTIL